MEFTEAYKQTGSYAFSPNARFLAVAVDYRLVIRDVLSLKVFHSLFFFFVFFWLHNWMLIVNLWFLLFGEREISAVHKQWQFKTRLLRSWKINLRRQGTILI